MGPYLGNLVVQGLVGMISGVKRHRERLVPMLCDELEELFSCMWNEGDMPWEDSLRLLPSE